MNPVIKSKIAEIKKLFEELDGLAAQETAPTQYPVFKQVGYLPAEWVTRFKELQAIPQKDRTEEQDAAIDEMYEQLPYPCVASEYPEYMEAGKAWMPSTCW